MTECLQLSRKAMGACAGLHDQRAGRKVAHQKEQLLARHLLAPEFMPTAILGMQVKDMFAEINADQRDFTHGSLPPRSNASSLGDASGDRADHFIMSA
ncbi:conserved protein of unknown function (plasmid) [Cupriavidus taiwanensis]|nr:conserved protein of unknown function [Cupriavidus taiwanensis]